jgi:SSS family solute:Na+ symporter
MGMILLYLKFENPSAAFTHTLNNLRYYINCGITVMICAAALLLVPNKQKVLLAFLITLPLNFLLQYLLPDMNYFVRAFWVIFISLCVATEGKISNFSSYKVLFQSSSNPLSRLGWTLLGSLILIHILFH